MGSLMYLMTSTRQDIAFAIQAVIKYLQNPGIEHWNAAKRILRYIKGTVEKGLMTDGAIKRVEQLVAFVWMQTTRKTRRRGDQ